MLNKIRKVARKGLEKLVVGVASLGLSFGGYSDARGNVVVKTVPPATVVADGVTEYRMDVVGDTTQEVDKQFRSAEWDVLIPDEVSFVRAELPDTMNNPSQNESDFFYNFYMNPAWNRVDDTTETGGPAGWNLKLTDNVRGVDNVFDGPSNVSNKILGSYWFTVPTSAPIGAQKNFRTSNNVFYDINGNAYRLSNNNLTITNNQFTIAAPACCFSNGTCQDLSVADCSSAGGTMQLGVTCASANCPTPNQACCFPSGSCSDLSTSECTTQGGTSQGAGTACSGATCPQPNQACYFSDGTCADLTTTDCATYGGVSQGSGTACAEIIANVELQGRLDDTHPGVLGDYLSRAVRFQVFSQGQPMLTVNRVISFPVDDTISEHLASNVSNKIWSGSYDCMRVRDRLHTLADSKTLVEIQSQPKIYRTSDDERFFLRGGNLNDESDSCRYRGMIDILDFGSFVIRFQTNYGTGNTDLNTPPYHVDITGDGLAFINDYTFIQSNFTMMSAMCLPCASNLTEDGNYGFPLKSIGARELYRKGLGKQVIADLNRDGILDQKDMGIFASGGYNVGVQRTQREYAKKLIREYEMLGKKR